MPDFERLTDVTRVASALPPQQARELRHATLTALCDPQGADAPAAGLDASDPGWLHHADGTLEEILHLATPPLQTSPWWLSYLLACPLPATLAVHITVGARAREQARQRRRWKRLRAAVIYKERRGQLVGSDEHDALEEAELVDGELAEEIGATVYKVGVYLAVRDPTGNAKQFDAIVGETARVFHSLTNAKVIRGRRLNVRGFTATLPLGVDTLGATRSYGQRNIADCVPLTSSSCGSPTGLVVGTADPGGTLERIDPFDPLFPRRVTLVLGPSGGGKTVLMNVLLMRAIAQGMRGWIIDRSSTPDQDGRTAGTGHYDTLLSLVPGARRVQVGSAAGDVICPWDVHDPAHVPAEKKEFLLALHALLIGHANGADRRERTLTAVEEGILSTAIDDVYARAAETGQRPRETMLLGAARRARQRRHPRRRERRRDPITAAAPRALQRTRHARAHRRPGDDRPRRRATDAVRPHRAARAAYPRDGPDARLPHRATGPADPSRPRRRPARERGRVGREAVPRRRGGLGDDREPGGR